jgi:hypothetical protein
MEIGVRPQLKNKWGLTPFIFLLALPALAAYDVNNVMLGASEKQVKSRFPQANCQPLEWKSRAADRRCDDSRTKVGDMEASVTFYLRNDAVEGVDVRFDVRHLAAMTKYLSTRYGAPTVTAKGDVKAEWKSNGERARITAEQGRRRASLFVWRGAFEDELYKIR